MSEMPDMSEAVQFALKALKEKERHEKILSIAMKKMELALEEGNYQEAEDLKAELVEKFSASLDCGIKMHRDLAKFKKDHGLT